MRYMRTCQMPGVRTHLAMLYGQDWRHLGLDEAFYLVQVVTL